MSIFLGLVALAIVAWYLAKIAWLVWLDMHIILGSPKRRPVDASQVAPRPMYYSQEMIVTLESLGFQRLGETETSVPYIKKTSAWILMNGDGTIQAETVFARVSFSTWFDADVLVETDYPTGEHLQTPTYQTRTITSSIQDALKYHQVQVDKYKLQYGAPQQILTMADHLRWEAMARENYSLIKMKRFLTIDAIKLLTVIYGVVVLLLLPRVGRGILPFMPRDSTPAEMELILLGLTLPIIPIHEMLARSALRGSRRDSRRIA